MHTARGAGASVGQRFDDDIALGGDLLFEVHGGDAREGRFRVAFHVGAQLAQFFFNPVQKNVAACFRDLEQSDGLALELLGQG